MKLAEINQLIKNAYENLAENITTKPLNGLKIKSLITEFRITA